MTQTEEQPAGSFPETPLTARLFRRLSEPLGVIDVRHPQFLQERSTAGILQRLDLLNQWKTRYGLTAPDAPVERASIAPSQTFVMRGPLPGSEGVTEFRTAQQLRVKRPSEMQTDDAPAPGTSANHTAVPSNNQAGTEARAPVSNGRTALLRDSEIVAAPSISSPQVSRQPLQRRGDAETPATTNEATVAPNRSGARVSQQQHSAPAATPVPPSWTSALPASLSHAPATLVTSQTGELVLRRKVTQQPPRTTSTSPRASGPDLLVARSTPITPLPGSVSLSHRLTTAASSPAPIFLDKKTSQADSPKPDLTTAPVRTPNFAPIAQEIPASSSVAGQPSIVWRRAHPDASPSSSSLPPPISGAPGAQMIMRSSAGTSSGLPAATLQSALTPSASHAGVDVEHLAERVSRVIARQLTVERERRGIPR